MKNIHFLLLCALFAFLAIPADATMKLTRADESSVYYSRSPWTPFPCPTMEQRRELSGHQNFTMPDHCKTSSEDVKDDKADQKPSRTDESDDRTPPEPETKKPKPEMEKPKPEPKPEPEQPTTSVVAPDKPDPSTSKRVRLRKKLSSLQHVSITDGGSYWHVRMPGKLTFETGRAYLKPGTRTSLKKLARALKSYDREVVIRGHADHRPIVSDDIKSRYPNNTILSRARATAAKFILTSFGVSDANVTIRPMGTKAPAYTSDHDDYLRLNRRVDFHITKDKSAK